MSGHLSTPTEPSARHQMLDEPAARFLLHLEKKIRQPVARLQQVRSGRRMTVRNVECS
jgi:hypothetical protein